MTLSAEQAYGEAAAEVVAERAEAMFGKRRGVLDTADIEGVHGMRVATRRLRAALEVFGPCLDRERGKQALSDVKALAAALGERRDRDVQLERLEHLHGQTEGAERHAVELLGAELRNEQARANRRLAKVLARTKRDRLRKRLRRLAR
jgi:CHAD domain-containing protein